MIYIVIQSYYHLRRSRWSVFSQLTFKSHASLKLQVIGFPGNLRESGIAFKYFNNSYLVLLSFFSGNAIPILSMILFQCKPKIFIHWHWHSTVALHTFGPWTPSINLPAQIDLKTTCKFLSWYDETRQLMCLSTVLLCQQSILFLWYHLRTMCLYCFSYIHFFQFLIFYKF